MRIGELSRRAGVSPRSLRYYEQHALIRSQRGANGYREYEEETIERAQAVRLLFDMGFSRDVVASVLTCIGDVPDSTHAAVIEKLREVRDDLSAQMERLTATHQRVSAFLDAQG